MANFEMSLETINLISHPKFLKSGLEVAAGKNLRIKKLGWVLYPGKQNPPENFGERKVATAAAEVA